MSSAWGWVKGRGRKSPTDTSQGFGSFLKSGSNRFAGGGGWRRGGRRGPDPDAVTGLVITAILCQSPWTFCQDIIVQDPAAIKPKGIFSCSPCWCGNNCCDLRVGSQTPAAQMSEYQRWQIDSILGWIKTYFTICEWMNIHLLTVNRDLSKRSLTEILPTELLYRDLVQEILPGDLLYRSCTETWWREQRSCSEIFYREREERSYIEISYTDPLLSSLIDTLYRYPYKGILRRGFYREPVEEILRTIFYRDLHKGNLQNLTWYLFFPRPPWMNPMLHNPFRLSL